MAAEVQVLSSHPLLTRAVERILTHVKDVRVRILPPAASEAQAMSHGSSPRLFLLDGCSLRSDLGRLAQRCRVQAPGSRFLALLPPENSGREEMLRLFYCGIDGFMELHKTWQRELLLAVQSILCGQLWVPPEVLLAFVKNGKALLDTQLLPGHFLTAREGQVFQFLLRGQTNKEISCGLGITERTVKYHVSNILSKLQLEDRRGLLPDKLTFKASTFQA